jgi:5'-nucleotidase
VSSVQASHEVRQAGLRTLTNLSDQHSSMGSNAPVSSITILHFNDVYNVEPADKEPVGGAARFACALKTYEHLNPLILFSGDAIAPSILSTFTKGEQMIPVLNECNVHCAVFGNHEFGKNKTNFFLLAAFQNNFLNRFWFGCFA